MANTPIHFLEFPLRVASPAQNEWYLLPAGTTLYYEKSMAEGFDRYKIYINVEGVDLGPANIVDDEYIAPLTAYPVSGDEIIDLLRQYPVSKQDIIRILNSSPISTEDAQEIIAFLKAKYADGSSAN